MPAKVQKYPLLMVDEPVTYNTFFGGMNTDFGDEQLFPNELRDTLNVDYKSATIVKRQGAKIMNRLVAPEPLTNIQGIFLFTSVSSYIILAANGKLYYGLYSEEGNIGLEKLPINFYKTQLSLIHNPINMTTGLEIYDVNFQPAENFHGGYVVKENDDFNFIGDYYELENNSYIRTEDYFFADNKYFRYIGTLGDFQIVFIDPETDTTFWEDITSSIGTYVEDPNTINSWNPNTIFYNKDLIVEKNGSYFLCKAYHLVRNNIDITLDNRFIEASTEVNFELIFQNKSKIEGATFNNKFYLATGTRIVEIFSNEGGELVAYVMEPKLLNTIVQNSIGLNYVSPYPEYCLDTETDQAITSISALVPLYFRVNGKNQFILKPIMTIAGNEDISEYFFRWEKFVNGQWVVLTRFQDNFYETINYQTNTPGVIKLDYSYIVVDDADKFRYRVSFAKDFEINQSPTETSSTTYVSESLIDEENKSVLDFKVDRVSGSYFGQASSVIYDVNVMPNQLFRTIQSCKKVFSDGNKFCFYDDDYNSGEWFKTVIDNPNYIGIRGGLSFKTNKNEALIKVVYFAGFIISFAYSRGVGGSIHLIQGNGDDVDTDQFYSPYRRKTIAPSISSDNPDTIQVAENLLFFKYFDTLYFIQAPELDKDRVAVYSANDKVKKSTDYYESPWNDNDCISEVTGDYYAIMWPEKNILEGDQVIKVRPATKLKLYYKMYQNFNNKIYFSWLRDESELFNAKYLFYSNNNPIYLHNDNLVTLNGNVYTDFDQIYECRIRLKSFDLEKPKMYKLLDNVTLFYNRNHKSDIDIEVVGFNEAGHKIIEWSKTKISQDIKTLSVGDIFNKDRIKLDSPSIDSKVINTSYKFPFLMIDVIISSKSEKDFSFSSVTFNYSTVDIPDQNPYQLYSSITRIKDNLTPLSVDSLNKE